MSEITKRFITRKDLENMTVLKRNSSTKLPVGAAASERPLVVGQTELLVEKHSKKQSKAARGNIDKGVNFDSTNGCPIRQKTKPPPTTKYHLTPAE